MTQSLYHRCHDGVNQSSMLNQEQFFVFSYELLSFDRFPAGRTEQHHHESESRTKAELAWACTCTCGGKSFELGFGSAFLLLEHLR